MTFQELNLSTPLQNALSDLGHTVATPIQEVALPVVLSGKDVVGIAQTGTGKTYAYLIPVLQQLRFSDQKNPRVLIVVPTRELVVQVIAEIKKLTKYINVRYVGVYGGTNINTQKKLIYEGLDILVGTPGRLADLALTGVLRFNTIQKLVIDEVDELFALGFRPQVLRIMEMLPAKRQNLMFSATLTEDVQELIVNYFREPRFVELVPQGTPLEKIDQIKYYLPNFYSKANFIELLLAQKELYTKVLVFVSNKKFADILAETIEEKFQGEIAVIHSNKSQNYRLSSLKGFKEGTTRILIATDVAARGLDISDISHVINFDVPENPEDYIHRIGRTGRIDKIGAAVTFVSEAEEERVSGIESFMKKEIPQGELPQELVFSQSLLKEEIPAPLFDKDYLKVKTQPVKNAAFHEKKGKNKKVNLGGPKKRNPKYGKPAKPKF